MRSFRNLQVFLAAALIACSPAADGPPLVSQASLSSPSGEGSAEPNLSVDALGRVHMTWLQRTSDSTFAMQYAVRDGAEWSVPRTLVDRSDLFVNWADFPSLYATRSGRLVAHWLQKSGAGRYAYDVVVRYSPDGGRTWTEPAPLNTDGVAGEHGFLSFVETGGDSVDAIWLDGRATSGDGHHGGSMQLATSRIGTDGGFTANTMLDTRICDCCQTSAAITSQGPVVVYRDRSDAEVRDIAIVRQVDGQWAEPAVVHADGWQIDACPVNGPAVAADGNRVAVAWFTGASDTARVLVAFSDDAGATFGAPIRIDEGQPLGRVDVELDGRERALVTWLERTEGEGAEVRLRAVDASGARAPFMAIARSSAGRPAGFPRMVRTGDHLVLAWTEPGTPSRIRMAEGRLTHPR
jgi:hypothetical protein